MEVNARFVIGYNFMEGYGFGFGGLYARYGTLVHHFFPYHLFHIRVPHSARRTLAYPFGRVLSAVAAYINRLLFSHSCAFSSKMIAQRYNFSMQGLQTPIEFFYFCE